LGPPDFGHKNNGDRKITSVVSCHCLRDLGNRKVGNIGLIKSHLLGFYTYLKAAAIAKRLSSLQFGLNSERQLSIFRMTLSKHALASDASSRGPLAPHGVM
jgi:hypothetical protein